MTQPIVLTAHQTAAVTTTLDLLEQEPVVAIRGLAGTGKTTLIPWLRQTLTAEEVVTSVGTPTHRAAMILKHKGVTDAATVHSLALTPYFLADYARLMAWLGEPVPCEEAEAARHTPDVDGLPWLAQVGLTRQGKTAKVLLAQARKYGAPKAALGIGVNGKDFFHKFGPKLGLGMLIIDEASMVGKEMLAMCAQAFDHIICIGDPGQLPPVGDDEVLPHLPGVDLTEIHRQAADSPIITLAYAARRDQQNWKQIPVATGQIDSLSRLDPGLLIQNPMLVWTNDLRVRLTLDIRRALGYAPDRIEDGEPLCCKATGQADRALGFVNNSHWRVLERSKRDPRRVTIQEEGREQTYDVLLHMEETDGKDVDPEAVPFRYGYVMTAHTAQGGEWPTVYISHSSLLSRVGAAKNQKDPVGACQWTYTAVTRAKQTLGFLTQHDFSPLMTIAPERKDPMPIAMTNHADTPEDKPALVIGPKTAQDAPQPDDIPDPVVPPEGTSVPPGGSLREELEAAIDQAGLRSTPPPEPVALPATVPTPPAELIPLAHGFCQYVQGLLGQQLDEAGIKMARSVDQTVTDMAAYTKGVLASNEHAQYSFADALAKITDKRPLPYQVQIRCRNAQGLELAFTITQATAQGMVDELTNLERWLAREGYTAPEVFAA